MGYDRFFIHKSIQKLGEAIIAKYGSSDQTVMLFPSRKAADLCVDFVLQQAKHNLRGDQVNILELVALNLPEADSTDSKLVSPSIFGFLMPKDHFPVAKQFWQHTGAGISSRRAEFCQALFESGHLVLKTSSSSSGTVYKGPRRYQRTKTSDNITKTQLEKEIKDQGIFVEERFGRNLNISLASEAKLAIRKRIAGSLTGHIHLNGGSKTSSNGIPRGDAHEFSETDVFLYPSGMHAIFSTYQCLLQAIGHRPSVCYG